MADPITPATSGGNAPSTGTASRPTGTGAATGTTSAAAGLGSTTAEAVPTPAQALLLLANPKQDPKQLGAFLEALAEDPKALEDFLKNPGAKNALDGMLNNSAKLDAFWEQFKNLDPAKREELLKKLRETNPELAAELDKKLNAAAGPGASAAPSNNPGPPRPAPPAVPPSAPQGMGIGGAPPAPPMAGGSIEQTSPNISGGGMNQAPNASVGEQGQVQLPKTAAEALELLRVAEGGQPNSQQARDAIAEPPVLKAILQLAKRELDQNPQRPKSQVLDALVMVMSRFDRVREQVGKTMDNVAKDPQNANDPELNALAQIAKQAVNTATGIKQAGAGFRQVHPNGVLSGPVRENMAQVAVNAPPGAPPASSSVDVSQAPGLSAPNFVGPGTVRG